MIRLKNVLRHLCKTSWRCLEDVFKTFWRRLEDVFNTLLQDVLKTSWRCLEDVLKMFLQDVLKKSWKCLEDVLARHLEDVQPRQICCSWPRRLGDIFWRRMTKANIFVLIKTSWRCLEDVFWRRRRKTSLRRLHRDECLLRYFIGNNEACRRMGEASKIPLNWERVLSLSLCRWFKVIAESQNTPREYVLFKSTPDDMYNDGTKGFSESVSRVFGKT